MRPPQLRAAGPLLALRGGRDADPSMSQMAKWTSEVVHAIIFPEDIVSAALLSVLVVTFVVQVLLGDRLELACAQNQLSTSRRSHRYRLVTAIFLHAGLAHLLCNSVTVARIGPRVSANCGLEGHLLIFLVAGVTGNVASAAWGHAPHEWLRAWLARRFAYARPRLKLPRFIAMNWNNAEAISLGASGGVYGQLGALLAAALLDHSRTCARSVLYAVLEIVAYSVLMPLFDGSLQNVGHTAHLAGLASGLILGLVLMPVGRLPRGLVRLMLSPVLFGVGLSVRKGWKATRALL